MIYYYNCPVGNKEIKLTSKMIFKEDCYKCPYCGCICELDYEGDLPDTYYFLVKKGDAEEYMRFKNGF